MSSLEARGDPHRLSQARDATHANVIGELSRAHPAGLVSAVDHGWPAAGVELFACSLK